MIMGYNDTMYIYNPLNLSIEKLRITGTGT